MWPIHVLPLISHMVAKPTRIRSDLLVQNQKKALSTSECGPKNKEKETYKMIKSYVRYAMLNNKVNIMRAKTVSKF